jgi:hypothetical protein
MIHQQPVQRDARPERNRPDPTRGTSPGSHTVYQDLAQHLTQRVTTGLVPRGAAADHRPHPATACQASDSTACDRSRHTETPGLGDTNQQTGPHAVGLGRDGSVSRTAVHSPAPTMATPLVNELSL